MKDTSLWPTVDLSLLSDENAAKFEKRQNAIQDYLLDKPVNEITRKFGIPRIELVRLLKRCLVAHPDGRIWGWRALISFRRQKSYERIRTVKFYPNSRHGGCSGALMQLFARLPHIQELVNTLFLKKKSAGIVHESRIPLKSIHKRFLDACRDAGVPATNYPFSVKNLGRMALWKYLSNLQRLKLASGVLARHGKDAARTLKSTNNGHPGGRILRPFQNVEFDAHRIDVFCNVSMPSPYGGFVKRVIERFWLLTIIEAITRTVLGYYISLNREYSAHDVLLCVRNAIVPWKRRGLTIPGLKYPERGGMPSEVIPGLAWTLWDEFSYDNDKANLSGRVLKKVRRVVGCAINAGPLETPEHRAIIERFFKTFEENGYHRLPSTTGSNPRDPRRNNPEEAAIRFDIRLEHMEELAEVLIMQYNGTPHSGIGYRTPLEYLQYFISDENILVRTLPEGKRSNMNLLNIETSRVVRGNINQGRRPYIEYEGARYQNDVLARTFDLVGTRLKLSVNPEDLRSLVAYLPNGSELGILTARGFWGRTPHTLEVRKAILKLKHRRLLWYTEEQDPIQVYIDYLATRATKSKAAAREFAKVQRMPKRGNNRPIRPVESEVEEPEDQPQTIWKTFTY
ncbi:MAG TPA: hypothetical protein VE732_08220 [Nitrososphaera sp.]|nr:hypothetical protein [Nitrososphaera sp.]